MILLRGTTEIFPSLTPSSRRVTGSTQPRCPAPQRISSAPALLRARRSPYRGCVTAAGMAKSRRPQEGQSLLSDPSCQHFTRRGTAFKLRERRGHPLGTSLAADRRAACASVRCRKYAGVIPPTVTPSGSASVTSATAEGTQTLSSRSLGTTNNEVNF